MKILPFIIACCAGVTLFLASNSFAHDCKICMKNHQSQNSQTTNETIALAPFEETENILNSGYE